MKNETFNSQILQIAPGNVSTIMLFKDSSTEQVLILHSGVTTLPKDEESK
jgi:hypothetical protein